MLETIIQKGKEAVISTAVNTIVQKGKEAVINTAVNTIIKTYGHRYLDGILQVVEVAYPTVTFKLAGVPDKTFSATIGTIEISEAGDQIRMGNFRSETEFVETALNRYVPEVIEISNSAAQAVLSKARVIL